MNIFNSPHDFDARKQVNLLTLPRSELAGPSNNDAPSSLLLQLPLHWTVEDFMESQGNSNPSSYFVFHQNEPSQHVSCVVESKCCSFTVHRVETSNVLVLVPPSSNVVTDDQLPFAAGNSETNDNEKEDDTDHSSKRSKLCTSLDPGTHASHLKHFPAQLLKSGGSGSFFLELRPKHLSSADLRGQLNTFDPYNPLSTSQGRTIRELALSMQVSQSQVLQGLTKLQALPLSKANPTQYTLIADHVLQDCFNAVIDGLILFGSGSEDYAGVGIVADSSFVDFVVQHVVSEEERFPDLSSVILHCLRFLQEAPLDYPEALSSSLDHRRSRYILDVAKVAKVVARRLFLKQPEPWDEVEFLTSWQSDLPGKGELYQVHRSMLRGIAIHTGSEMADADDFQNSNICPGRLWHFLPLESVPSDPDKCFATIFSLKERWCMYELEPYLDHLVDASSNSTSSAEILLRYTKQIRVDRDGLSRTFYQRK